MIYAVLLAFTTVVVWEHFSEADGEARQEVDAATDVWRFSRFLAPVDARRIGNDIDAYAVAVATDEWPLMQSGRSSRLAQRLTIALMGDVVNVPAGDRSRANLQNHLLDRVQVMADLRRRRINDNETIVLPVIKLALLLGAAAIIGFLYLFGLKNFRVQLLMTAATAGVIGLLLALIVLLDYPFRGDVSISPARWFELHHTIAEKR